MVGSIVVDGGLKHRFTPCMIWKPHWWRCSISFGNMFYVFELDYKAAGAYKKDNCSKAGGALDPSRITKRCKKFYRSCKNLDDQLSSRMLITMDFEAMPRRLIHWVAFKKYQSGSHCQLYIVNFVKSAITWGAIELSIRLKIFWTTLNSPLTLWRTSVEGSKNVLRRMVNT